MSKTKNVKVSSNSAPLLTRGLSAYVISNNVPELLKTKNCGIVAAMLYEWAGKIWRNLPRRARYAILGLVEPKFLVTAGAVVTDEAGRVLLLKHVFHAGSGWGVPGGFIEKGESADEALRRELREEIGLEIADVRLSHTRTLRQPQQVELVFTCRPAGKLGAMSHEIERAEWFTLDALPPGLSEQQRELLVKALPNSLQK